MINPNFNKDLADALKEFNKKTNADRIRAMSDEELAELLAKGCHETRNCPTIIVGPFPYDDVVESCEKCWLEYLHKEAE